MRPPFIAPCALSPTEFEAYDPLVQQLESQSSVSDTPSSADCLGEVWDWLSHHVDCSNSVETEIQAFFKSPGQEGLSIPRSHILLACLRLVAHSRSSKHLTRDHLFIQTDPVELKVNWKRGTGELGSKNPFQPRNDVGVAPQASTSRSSVSRGPAPPLPTKRRPSSPTLSTLPSTNPFSNPNSPVPPSPPRLPSSSPSPASLRADAWESKFNTPPLPPRPESAKETSSYKRRGMVPPPPVRSSSNTNLPPSSRLSIIGSSSTSHRPASTIGPPVPTRRPSTKLLASTHISPTTSLRTSPSPSGRSVSESTSREMRRSESSVSDLSGRSGKRGEDTMGPKGDVVVMPALVRSRTLGSKPPPPPKRRPESLTLDRSNPFLSHATLSSHSHSHSHPKPIQRAVSLSSARSAPPFGTVSAPAPAREPSSRHLYPFKGDLSAMLQSQAVRSEEWIVKTRESMGGRAGSSRRASGGVLGDREALFDGSEDEAESEEEMVMSRRRSHAERNEVGREEGWSQLQA